MAFISIHEPPALPRHTYQQPLRKIIHAILMDAFSAFSTIARDFSGFHYSALLPYRYGYWFSSFGISGDAWKIREKVGLFIVAAPPLPPLRIEPPFSGDIFAASKSAIRFAKELRWCRWFSGYRQSYISLAYYFAFRRHAIIYADGHFASPRVAIFAIGGDDYVWLVSRQKTPMKLRPLFFTALAGR